MATLSDAPHSVSTFKSLTSIRSAEIVPVFIQAPSIVVVPPDSPAKVTRPVIFIVWLAICTPSAISLIVLDVSPLDTDNIILLAYCSMADKLVFDVLNL